MEQEGTGRTEKTGKGGGWNVKPQESCRPRSWMNESGLKGGTAVQHTEKSIWFVQSATDIPAADPAPPPPAVVDT